MRALCLLFAFAAFDCHAATDCTSTFVGDWEADLVKRAAPDERATADNWHHLLFHFEADGTYDGSVMHGDAIASLRGRWTCADAKLSFIDDAGSAALPPGLEATGPVLELRRVDEKTVVLFDPSKGKEISFERSDWSHPAAKEAVPATPPPAPANDREREAVALLQCQAYAAMGLILAGNDPGDRNRFGIAARRLASDEFLRSQLDAVTHRVVDGLLAGSRGDGSKVSDAKLREIEKDCLARLAKVADR